MTIDISANVPRISYTVAAGVTQTSFTVPFEFFDDSDLNVYIDQVLQTITTNYTVAGGSGSTGTVTMTVTGPKTVIITRDTTIERTTDFTAGVDINRAALNTQLDTLTAIAADNKDFIERSIRIKDFDPSIASLELPDATTRANKLLSFDTEGGVSVQAASDLLTGSVLGANYTKASYTGNGSTTAYSTVSAAGSKNNIQVYIDGVYQNKDTFSISGAALTFTEAPPLNSAIEFIVGNAVTSITGDANAITYDQGGTGSQDRTVQNKLQDTVSVKDFGAVGDGVTNDASAVQAAIDACETLKKPLFFPAGTYYMTSGITVQQKEVHIIGEGSESTILDFNVSSGVAMDVGYSGGGTFWGWTIRDIQVKGNASGSETDLLKINYPLNGKMERVKVDFANGVGVNLGRPQNFVIHASEIRNADSSGIIVQNDFVSGQGGQLFVLDNSTIKDNGTTDGEPSIKLLNGAEHVISNCIIEGSTSAANIYLGTDLTKITNCSFESGTGAGSHIQIGSTTIPQTTTNCFIGHNNFNASDASTQSIDAQSYSGIVISNNQFQSGGRMTLGSDEGNKYSIVDGNHGLDVLTEITDSGTTDGKIIYRNSNAGTTTDTVQTITDGDTTPDVRGINTLHTANTGATTITRFTGTASGDVFSVKVGDANTTIENGTYIVTGTGSNLTPSSGDLITFVSVAGTAAGSVPVAYVIFS